MNKAEITHLERMIELHKKNLYTLEEMLAKYGTDQPLHLINSVTMEKEAIARYSKQIEGLPHVNKEREKTSVLANLPRRPYFVGREDELRAVLQSLQPNSRTFIIGIEGIGGVGKSALAIEISHRCVEDDLFESGYLDFRQGIRPDASWDRTDHPGSQIPVGYSHHDRYEPGESHDREPVA